MKRENILEVIRQMNDTNEEMIILKYENIFCRLFYTPILLLGAILNFIVMYLIWNQDIKVTLINSFFMISLFLLFELFSQRVHNERLKSHIFTLIFSATLIFSVMRFYYLIGPTVWTISLTLVMISMVRLKKSMLIMTSVTVFLLGIYVWCFLSDPFYMGTIYYVAQNVSFAIFIYHRCCHS